MSDQYLFDLPWVRIQANNDVDPQLTLYLLALYSEGAGSRDGRKEGENNMSRQSDIKVSMQVRIGTNLHRVLKIMAAEENRSIKEILEDAIKSLLESKRIKI